MTSADTIANLSLVSAFSRKCIETSNIVQGKLYAAPSPVVDGHYFPPYTARDANRDIGDSAITEASGLGGFAVGGAPAITGVIGSNVEALMQNMLDMYQITVMESNHFSLPVLNGRGTPTGVDVLRVLET